jgi:hypothetical protein
MSSEARIQLKMSLNREAIKFYNLALLFIQGDEMRKARPVSHQHTSTATVLQHINDRRDDDEM